MEKERYFVKFDEQAVLKLAFVGPASRRIYVVTQTDSSTPPRELFVQRTDAFTTNLLGLMKNLQNSEIAEIRYACGIDGFMRIYLDEKGKLVGEYSSRSERSLEDLKRKLKTQ
jgi:hypothetical protein